MITPTTPTDALKALSLIWTKEDDDAAAYWPAAESVSLIRDNISGEEYYIIAITIPRHERVNILRMGEALTNIPASDDLKAAALADGTGPIWLRHVMFSASTGHWIDGAYLALEAAMLSSALGETDG